MKRGILTWLACAALTLSAQPGPIGAPAWTYEAKSGPAGNPTPIGKADGARGLLVTLTSGEILWLNPQGKVERRMKLDLDAAGPAVAGALWNDGRLGIVATDAWGSIYCFDENGKRLWKYARESSMGSYRLPVLADLDGDGKLEILSAEARGHLLAVDADGKLRLDFQVTDYRLSPPAVGDLNGDGKPEIVFGTDDREVYAISGQGELLWRTKLQGRFGRTLPLIADLDQDGRAEVYVSIAFLEPKQGVFALDAQTGKMLWQGESKLQSYNSMVAADLDGDGKTEMLFGDKNTFLYTVNAAGKKLWESQVDGRGLFFAPVAARLAASGPATLFICVRNSGTNGKALYAMSGQGKELQALPLPGGGTYSPQLVRFAGSKDLQLVVVSGSGQVTAYGLAQTPGQAKILWGGMRNDAHNQGYAAGKLKPFAWPAAAAVTAEKRDAWTGTNSLKLKAVSKNGVGSLRVRRPDGAIDARVLRIEPELAAPRLTYMAPMGGEYKLDIRWSGAGAQPAPESYVINVPVDGRMDIDRQKRFEPKVEALRAQLPGRDALIDGILATTRASLQFSMIRKEPAVYDRAADERHALLAMGEYLAGAKPKADILVTPIHNPWPNTDYTRHFQAVKASQAAPNAVAVKMAGNEYESVAVVVSNLKNTAVSLHFETQPFAGAGEAKVAGKQVLSLSEVPLIMPESTGRLTEDVLPKLAEGQLLRLAPLESRKLWLTFHSRELKAGTWQGKLLAGDLASTDVPLEIGLRVEVSPVRIPDRHTYKHVNWLYLSNIADPEIFEATVKDAVEHGTNVFNTPAVTVNFDAAGKITGANSEAHDRLVKRLKGQAFFMIGGSVNVGWPKDFKPSPELADRAYADALRWYARYMESLGVSRDEYALYIQDEPGLMGHDENYVRWMATVRKVKAIDPQMKIYANPAGGAKEDILQPIAKLIDVWQPDLHLVRENPEGLGKMFGQATYWHYEAPADQRNLDPLGYYRAKPWVAFQMGMTGGGFWVYSGSGYWFFNRTLPPEYGSVYATDRGPVTTKRWEASRDGIEDFELLWMLKEKAAQSGSAEAKALLDESVKFVTAGQDQVSDISRQLRPYTAEFDRWMAYRTRILTALEKLGGGQ